MYIHISTSSTITNNRGFKEREGERREKKREGENTIVLSPIVNRFLGSNQVYY
jgi:hypothetical protein